ncbi:Thioredoxin-like fold [Lactarius tabidus]
MGRRVKAALKAWNTTYVAFFFTWGEKNMHNEMDLRLFTELFSHILCDFSRKFCNLLKEQRVEFRHFDVLTDESVGDGLKRRNDWPTYPQLIINGEFVGVLDIVQEMVENGEFSAVVA